MFLRPKFSRQPHSFFSLHSQAISKSCQFCLQNIYPQSNHFFQSLPLSHWSKSPCISSQDYYKSKSLLIGPLAYLFGEGNGNPLQYSCLQNPMDGGARQAIVHGFAKSWTWRSKFTFTFHFHALEKEMATHSSVLAWRLPGTGAWWAAVYGVAQSRTLLMWLSSSSSLFS